MSKRRLSLSAAAGEEGVGFKLPRLSSVREEALLASLEQAWASAARAQCEQQGVPPSARAALERYLHGMQASIFSAVRSSRSASSASASASAEAAEPLDRELALEVARLEKAVEKLGKTVKEARDSVSACAAHLLRPSVRAHPPSLTLSCHNILYTTRTPADAGHPSRGHTGAAKVAA